MTLSLLFTNHQKCTKCIALRISNFADSHFICVHCNKTLLAEILCRVSKAHHKCSDNSAKLNTTIQTTPSSQFCGKQSILYSQKCFMLLWIKKENKSKCHVMVQDFDVLFHAVEVTEFPPFISNNTLVQPIQYYKSIEYKELFLHKTPQLQGICIVRTDKLLAYLHLHIHKCAQGSYISPILLCNGVKDCPGQDTEENLCKHTASATQNKPTEEKEIVCAPLFNRTESGTCSLYLEPAVVKSENGDVFICENGTRIGQSLVDDLMVDCPSHGEDERILHQTLMLNQYFLCTKRHQIPCRQGHSRCFNISQICTYVLNSLGHLVPCRTGEHLQHCRWFQCDIMFKCSNYYCTHWKYVCDGKWDCPEGDDESLSHQCATKRNCSGFFLCKGYRSMCLHFTSVCDAEVDCPFSDDEFLCSLKDIACPAECSCLTFAIWCKDIQTKLKLFKTFVSFKVITMENYTFKSHVALNLPQAICLVLTKSSLQDVCVFYTMSPLQILNTAENSIKAISKNCLTKVYLLFSLDLSSNKISELRDCDIVPLIHLQCLNLSNNPIQHIDVNSFVTLKNLKIVSLMEMNDLHIDDYFLKGLVLDTLQVIDYKLCCLVLESTTCSMNIPWYFSCQCLLPSQEVKLTFYTISGGILLGNVISVVMQQLTFKKGLEKTRAFGLMVCSVNVVDLFLSFPLISLWIADLSYHENFVFYFDKWRSSTFCYIILQMFLNFNIISPVILCLLSVSRLMIVEHPVNTGFKESAFVGKRIAVLATMCFVMSCLFCFFTWAIDAKILHNELPMTLCSPFLDPGNKMIMVKITTWTVSLLQCVSIIGIITIYVKLVLSLQKSQENLKNATSATHSYVTTIVQFVVITGSNIICWIPSCAIFLFSTFSTNYPMDMLIWTTIAVNPVNSLINPAVFIVTSMRKLYNAHVKMIDKQQKQVVVC